MSIASLTVTNSRLKVLLNIVPNAYPASRVLTRKEPGDESLVAFIQVLLPLNGTWIPDSSPLGSRIFSIFALTLLYTVFK